MHFTYSVNQEIAFFQHVGLSLKPDLALLCFYINDFDIYDIREIYKMSLKYANDSGYYYFDLKSPANASKLMKWKLVQMLRRSRIFMYIHDRLLAFNARKDYSFKFLHGIKDTQIVRMIDKVDPSLKIFKDLLVTNDVRGMVIIIPVANQINEELLDQIYQKTLIELCRKHGLEYIDLLPSFRTNYEITKKLPVLPFDGHYDSLAQRIIADKLFHYIVNIHSHNTK